MSIVRRRDPLVPRADGPLVEFGHPPANDLMIEIANGSTRAFEALYDQFASTVLGIVRQVLRDPEQSATVTTAAFVEIWTTASRFASEDQSPRSWICAVAHRHAVAELRHRPRPSSPAPFQPTKDSVGASPMTVDLERIGAAQMLGQLDAIARRSIELAYYTGLTCDQIAAALAVGPDTISHSIRAGLTQMRNARVSTSAL